VRSFRYESRAAHTLGLLALCAVMFGIVIRDAWPLDSSAALVIAPFGLPCLVGIGICLWLLRRRTANPHAIEIGDTSLTAPTSMWTRARREIRFAEITSVQQTREQLVIRTPGAWFTIEGNKLDMDSTLEEIASVLREHVTVETR
jgi:hypothetical protein